MTPILDDTSEKKKEEYFRITHDKKRHRQHNGKIVREKAARVSVTFSSHTMLLKRLINQSQNQLHCSCLGCPGWDC